MQEIFLSSCFQDTLPMLVDRCCTDWPMQSGFLVVLYAQQNYLIAITSLGKKKKEESPFLLNSAMRRYGCMSLMTPQCKQARVTQKQSG